jgi:hypothetical protein
MLHRVRRRVVVVPREVPLAHAGFRLLRAARLRCKVAAAGLSTVVSLATAQSRCHNLCIMGPNRSFNRTLSGVRPAAHAGSAG